MIKGSKHINESKKKMSIALKGRLLTREHRRKIGEGNRGKNTAPKSEEHRKKLSLAKLGKRYGPHSQEWNDNISKAVSGFKHSEETKKKMKGRKISEETRNIISKKTKEAMDKIREKLSELSKNRWANSEYKDAHIKKWIKTMNAKYPQGTNWKGGLSFELYGKEFNKGLKNQIRNRDNHQCQECRILENGHKFPVHHIDYNKKNNNPNNLISLCTICHVKTNYKREDWENYFLNKIAMRG